MSAAGAIKAGAAYVEAFLDDNKVTRGLDALKGKLKTWSATLGSIAAATHGGALPEPLASLMEFTQSPAGVFVALSAAAKETAEAREEMGRLAEKAGLTVEKFSALAYAARQMNVSNEALASGLKNLEARLFKAGSAAGQGKKALTGALNALGIDPKTVVPSLAGHGVSLG